MNSLNLSPQIAPYVALFAIVLIIGITLNIANLRRSRKKKGQFIKRDSQAAQIAPLGKRISTEEWHRVTKRDMERFRFPNGDD